MTSYSYRKDSPSVGETALLGTLLTVSFAVIVFVISLPILLLRGWAFEKLWNWFVFGHLSNFHMSWILGSGISMMIGFLTAQTNEKGNERTTKEKYLVAGGNILSPLLVVFFGWVLTLFL